MRPGCNCDWVESTGAAETHLAIVVLHLKHTRTGVTYPNTTSRRCPALHTCDGAISDAKHSSYASMHKRVRRHSQGEASRTSRTLQKTPPQYRQWCRRTSRLNAIPHFSQESTASSSCTNTADEFAAHFFYKLSRSPRFARPRSACRSVWERLS